MSQTPSQSTGFRIPPGFTLSDDEEPSVQPPVQDFKIPEGFRLADELEAPDQKIRDSRESRILPQVAEQPRVSNAPAGFRLSVSEPQQATPQPPRTLVEQEAGPGIQGLLAQARGATQAPQGADQTVRQRIPAASLPGFSGGLSSPAPLPTPTRQDVRDLPAKSPPDKAKITEVMRRLDALVEVRDFAIKQPDKAGAGLLENLDAIDRHIVSAQEMIVGQRDADPESLPDFDKTQQFKAPEPLSLGENLATSAADSLRGVLPRGSIRDKLFGQAPRPGEGGVSGFVGEVAGAVAPSATALVLPVLWPFVIAGYAGSSAASKFEENQNVQSAVGAGVFEAGAEFLGLKFVAKIGTKVAGKMGRLIFAGKLDDAVKVMAGVAGISGIEGVEELVTLVGTELNDALAGVKTFDDAINNIRTQAPRTAAAGALGGLFLVGPSVISPNARAAFRQAAEDAGVGKPSAVQEDIETTPLTQEPTDAQARTQEQPAQDLAQKQAQERQPQAPEAGQEQTRQADKADVGAVPEGSAQPGTAVDAGAAQEAIPGQEQSAQHTDEQLARIETRAKGVEAEQIKAGADTNQRLLFRTRIEGIGAFLRDGLIDEAQANKEIDKAIIDFEISVSKADEADEKADGADAKATPVVQLSNKAKEVIKKTGLPETSPGLENTGLPRATDPPLGTEFGSSKLVQIWRTASGLKADGVLHLTLKNVDTSEFSLVGRDADKLLKKFDLEPPLTDQPTAGKTAIDPSKEFRNIEAVFDIRPSLDKDLAKDITGLSSFILTRNTKEFEGPFRVTEFENDRAKGHQAFDTFEQAKASIDEEIQRLRADGIKVKVVESIKESPDAIKTKQEETAATTKVERASEGTTEPDAGKGDEAQAAIPDDEASKLIKADTSGLGGPPTEVWFYPESKQADRDRIMKQMRVNPRPSGPAKPGRSKAVRGPTKPPAFKTRTRLLQAVEKVFRSREPSKFAITDVLVDQDGNRLIATNGRLLVTITDPARFVDPGVHGLNKNGIFGKRQSEKDKDFVPFEDILKQPVSEKITIDPAVVFNQVQRATVVVSGVEGSHIVLVRNTDGTLGMASGKPGVGVSEVNVLDGFTEIGAFPPKALKDVSSFLASAGVTKAQLHIPEKPENAKAIFKITGTGNEGREFVVAMTQTSLDGKVTKGRVGKVRAIVKPDDVKSKPKAGGKEIDGVDNDNVDLPVAPETEDLPETNIAGNVAGFPLRKKGILPKDPINLNYDPYTMPMRLERPMGEASLVNAPQAIQMLGDAIESLSGTAGRAVKKRVPILVGRIRNKKAAGSFEIGPEVIRIRTANDIITASHEAGHAIEKLAYGWPKATPWKDSLVSKLVQDELNAAGKKIYTKRPDTGWRREGFAEFIKLWITNRSVAKEQLPQISRWFEKEFLPIFGDFKSKLDKTARLVEGYQEQGSFNRGKAGIVDLAHPARRIEATFRRSLQFARDVKGNFVEPAAPLEVLKKMAEKIGGKKIPLVEDPFLTHVMLRHKASARVRFMVEHGMTDISTTIVGPSLRMAVKRSKATQIDFAIYLWARRSLALWNDPRGPRNSGLSKEDAIQIIKEIETDDMIVASQMVYDWNDGVLNYAAQASESFAQIVEKIRARDPGYFIPLKRVFEQLQGALDSIRAAGEGPVKGGASGFVKRLKGSGLRIKEPFGQMIADAKQTVSATHRRVVLDNILKIAAIPGMGEIIREVPKDKRIGAQRTLQQVIDELKRNKVVDDVLLNEEELSNAEQEDVDLMSEVLTFFTEAQIPRQGAVPTIPIYDNGKIRWFEVNQNIYETLNGMDIFRMGKMADMLVAAPVRVFKTGTVGIRPSFGLVANPSKDVLMLWTNTRSNANAAQVFGNWLGMIVSSGLNAASSGSLTISPALDFYIRMGGEMIQPLGQDVPQTRRAVRRLWHGRVVNAIDPRNMLDYVRDIVQFPESATRATEIALLAKEHNIDLRGPISFEQSMILGIPSQQVTSDFTSLGNIMVRWNQMVPFTNSQIQGPRSSIRAFRRRPARFLLRGFMAVTVPTLMLWWQIKDEDWYIEMPWRTKFFNWWFDSGDQLMKLARPHELGVFFAAMPEMLLDAWYRQDPEAVIEWFKFAEEMIRPTVTPMVLQVAKEQYADHQDFWDRPIVSKRFTGFGKKTPPGEQFTEYTTEAAKFLGRMFPNHVSPQRVDHLARNLGGPVTIDLLDLVGLGRTNRTLERQNADLPVIGRLFNRGQFAGRPLSITKLYDTLEEALIIRDSSRIEETQILRQRRLLLNDATRAISGLGYIRANTPSQKVRDAITRKQIEFAKASVERASEVDLLKKLHALDEKQAKAAFKKRREPFKRLRKSVKQLKEGVEKSLNQ